MPLPRMLAQINKRIFNPRALDKGSWPVLTHIGRKSGKTLRTPLDAYPTDSGYLFVLMYGAESDWTQNVLAAGKAKLTVEGKDIDLTAPQVIGKDEAVPLLPPGTKPPPGFLGVNDYLLMKLA